MLFGHGELVWLFLEPDKGSTVREPYSRDLEQGPLQKTIRKFRFQMRSYLQFIFSQQPCALVEKAIIGVDLGFFRRWRRRWRYSARRGGWGRGGRCGELDGGVGSVHLQHSADGDVPAVFDEDDVFQAPILLVNLGRRRLHFVKFE